MDEIGENYLLFDFDLILEIDFCFLVMNEFHFNYIEMVKILSY